MNLAGFGRRLAAAPHVVRMTLSAMLVMVWAANTASASAVGEVEPNDSILTAQNVDAFFSLDFDANIGDAFSNTSESMPHVTVLGTGNESFDYYSFTVASPGKLGIFDIDFASEGGFDSHLQIYNSVGDLLSGNDDSSTDWGQLGSTSGLDSYFEYAFPAAGAYAIEVGSCCVGTVPNGASYQLQISIGDAPPPPPAPNTPILWEPAEGGNGHVYMLIDSLVTWHEARDLVAALTPPAGFRTGHLVTVSDDAENLFLYQLFSSYGLAWLGFTDELVEGEWRWIDDAPGIWQDPDNFVDPVQTAFTAWDPSDGEPNDYIAGEDYSVLFWNGSLWNDYGLPYTDPLVFYIVEFEAVPEPGSLVLALGLLSLTLYRESWKKR